MSSKLSGTIDRLRRETLSMARSDMEEQNLRPLRIKHATWHHHTPKGVGMFLLTQSMVVRARRTYRVISKQAQLLTTVFLR
jgi:hypothetical protein